MIHYFLCAGCFGRKTLDKSNGDVVVDRLLFWWFCVWIWKNKYVSLYIIEFGFGCVVVWVMVGGISSQRLRKGICEFE
jgi:hypothetical protein